MDGLTSIVHIQPTSALTAYRIIIATDTKPELQGEMIRKSSARVANNVQTPASQEQLKPPSLSPETISSRDTQASELLRSHTKQHTDYHEPIKDAHPRITKGKNLGEHPQGER